MKRPGHARGVKAVSALLAGLLGLLPTWNAMVFGQAVDPGLVAAVLPSSRSTEVGRAASAFVTIVNPGSQAIGGVGVFLRGPLPAVLTFQPTDPSTNALTGTVNVPVTVGAGQAQTFAIFVTPTAAFPPTLVEFDFGPGVPGRVPPIPGVNTLLLSASDGATADIVAVAATASRDGILNASVSGSLATARATIKAAILPPFPRRGSFAVAAINAGSAEDTITVTAVGTGAPAPRAIVQETDPATGAVVGGNTKRMAPGQIATFAVSAVALNSIPLDPARNRVVVEFRDGAGVVRGGTSVAFSTAHGDRVARGAELFFVEQFGGNGRTCGTCHPADNNFTLDSAFIASLPPDDPLFIAETNPGLAALENSRLLREFALITENLDGFERAGVLRGVPHTLALATSVRSSGGPRTGWSGDGAPGDRTLRAFATGAVTQHFTRTLQRVPGIDFRLPTDDELVALDVFQLSLGRQTDLSLPLRLKGSKALTGQAVFLDKSVGRCNVCHVNAGATANLGAGSLGNEDFDTGVENFTPEPGRPPDQPIPRDGGAGRNIRSDGGFGNGRFNTPPLVEAATTPPFFHDNAVQTIEDAVAFYTSDAFRNSPGARDAGGPIVLSPTQIAEIGAFLRVIAALESMRSADAMLEESTALTGNLLGRLLELVNRSLVDARRVLEDAGLHPDAAALLDEARTAMGHQLIDAARANILTARGLLIED